MRVKSIRRCSCGRVMPISSAAMGPSTVWARPVIGERAIAIPPSLGVDSAAIRARSALRLEVWQPPDEHLVERAVLLPRGEGLVDLRLELRVLAADPPG